MSLFNWNPKGFKLHSGDMSPFLIDCSVLTDEDWQALARMVYEKLGERHFRKVVGVPMGGLKLARELIPFRFPNPEYPILIVDDVLTTGRSMEEVRAELGEDCIGTVVFVRGDCPDWITPLWAGKP